MEYEEEIDVAKVVEEEIEAAELEKKEVSDEQEETGVDERTQEDEEVVEEEERADIVEVDATLGRETAVNGGPLTHTLSARYLSNCFERVNADNWMSPQFIFCAFAWTFGNASRIRTPIA